jgi:hypothetical protein
MKNVGPLYEKLVMTSIKILLYEKHEDKGDLVKNQKYFEKT